MKVSRGFLFALLRALIVVLVCAAAVLVRADDKKVQKQQEIRDRSAKTLERLYEIHPEAKSAIAKAAGYAVFSNTGVKIMIAGSGKGKGLAFNNKTKKETFMKMMEVQAGLGIGVKKFSVIFIFDKQDALKKFIDSGWDMGGQSTVAATTGKQGGGLAGAASIADGVWMYQMTDKGVAVEITAKGTKYYKDSDLN